MLENVDFYHWFLVCTYVKTPSWIFYSASSLKKLFVDRHVTPTRTHYPDFEPISLCSFSLKLRA